MSTTEVMENSNFTIDPLSDPFLNIPISDVDIGRESIPILDLSTSFGRESLGILKLGCDLGSSNLSELNFSRKPPNDISSYNNVFDNAFLISSNSDLRSISTYSSIKMSDISNSSLIRESNNQLNKAFLGASPSNDSILTKLRSRFYSVPASSQMKKETDNEYLIQEMIKRVSDSCQMKVHNSSMKENVQEEESTFNDSVFIEARHLTSKFSGEGSNDGFLLDETDPPELIDGDLEESKTDIKCDNKEIFKKIDMLMPVNGHQKMKEKLDNQSLEPVKDMQSSPITNDYSTRSDVVDNGKEQVINGACNSQINRSNEAQSTPTDLRKSREVFKNLSQILAKNNLSHIEVEQGQTLLNTLADMVGNGLRERSKSFTNSTAKSNSGYDNIKERSASTQCCSLPMIHSKDESNIRQVKKIASNSLQQLPKQLISPLVTSLGQSPSFEKSRNGSAMSNASESSREMKSLNSENSLFNLRPKKISNAQVKRGPMKATIPVENFTNIRQKGISPKPQQALPKYTSRMSTPIRVDTRNTRQYKSSGRIGLLSPYVHQVQGKLRPMAQSTPDNKTALSSSIEQPNARSFSSSNIQEKSSNYSSSLSHKELSVSKDRSSSQKSQLPRRNSVSEVKGSQSSYEFKRSNSLKEGKLMKTMCKIRQNIANSPGINKSVLRDSSNISGKDLSKDRHGKINDISRRGIKTFGKENTSMV